MDSQTLKTNKPYILTFLAIFFSAFFPFSAHSVCGNIPGTYPLFSETELILEKNITVNGISVSSGTYTPNAAIDINGVVSTTSQTLPDLNPLFFPSNNSTNNLDITTSTTINNTSEAFYDNIEINSENISVSFTGGGDIHIDDLKVKKKNTTLNFAAGTYYINKFNIENDKNDVTINISSSPVIFHIGDEFKIEGEDASINTSGNVDDFLVYLHTGAEFESKKKNLDFTGLIYGPNNVDKVKIEGENSSIHGAIIVSGGQVEITKENTSFTYTTADQTAINNINSCGTGSVGMSSCGNIPATYPQFSNTEIILDQNISINGTPVNSGTYSTNAAIDINGVVSTNISQTLPGLDPLFFPSNSASNDLNITTSTTINQSSEFFYDNIDISSENIIVSFTGGGDIHIDDLKVKKNNTTLNFAAGTYYINKFNIEKDKNDVTINISSSPVIFHIGDEFKIEGRDVNINSSGNVEDFLVYLHAGAKFENKKNDLDFTGLIYGPNNVDNVKIEGNNNSIHGAIIISGGKIEVKDNNAFTYTTSDQTAIGNISTCRSGAGGGSDTAASEFNCVENGANGISGTLYTKTTSQSFSFDIVALQDASTIETSFASGADHTVTVELVDTSSPGSCSVYPVLNPAVSQSLIFTSSDSGAKISAPMNSGTAYSNVKCRVTDATENPSVIGCSTDSFAIRPTAITITSNLTNTGSTGTPKAKAGESFTLTATATTGYSGTPAINNSNIQAHSGSIQTGALSGSFSPANSATGIATGSAFNYSEVGSLRFTAQGIFDDSFTSVDQSGDCSNDFSNTIVSGKVGCKFGNTATSSYFGRFYPDHFEVTASSNGIFSNSCTGFTYSGQAFGYQTAPTLTVTAYNGLGTPTITQNYTGSFSKLTKLDFNVSPPLALSQTPSPSTYYEDSSTSNTTASANVRFLWTVDTGALNLNDNNDGSHTLSMGNDEYTYVHETINKIDKFTSDVTLTYTSITDSDGVNTLGLPHTLQPTATEIRFGRLNIDNVHGSELINLPVPVYTEYYNGTSFVTNAADICTTISAAQLSFNGGANPITVGSGSSTASIVNSPLLGGIAGLALSAPGANNTGYVDITSNAFIAAYPWLNYDWDSDGSYDDPPSARATFGIYEGNSNQIYFREVY